MKQLCDNCKREFVSEGGMRVGTDTKRSDYEDRENVFVQILCNDCQRDMKDAFD